MKIRIEIYQVCDKAREIKFMDFEYALQTVKDFKRNLNDFYKKVYEYEGIFDDSNPINVLEQIYAEFNTSYPENFRGHALSVSDIVKLDDDLFYCDEIGWVKI